MNSFISIVSFTVFLANSARGGIITHHEGGLGEGGHHHERATSYQNIHMEHFHPVPTFIKKEHKHLLEHPISIGKSSSKVEIHHGGKHDHGYAIATIENDLHSNQGHGGGLELGNDYLQQGQQQESYQGHEELTHQGHEELSQQGHEGLALADAPEGYQVHDHQGADYSQYQGHQEAEVSLGHGAYGEGADLGQYQLAGYQQEGYQQEEAGGEYENHHGSR